jgi:integrase
VSPEEEAAGFGSAQDRLRATLEANPDDLEPALGPLLDRLLLAEGIAELDPECRTMVLGAFALALVDAFARREREAEGDYRPDPKSERFPEWQAPKSPVESPPAPRGKQSLTGLVGEWWREAQATGRKRSTYESYRNSMAALVAFLKHDDASRVTPEDLIRFKDYRLASINPRTGKPISPKTVKDSDLAGLKTVFGNAVTNRRMATNPAAGLTIKVGKRPKLRSKGFTDEEARALLRAALTHKAGSEQPRTAAAKRWVPWLCAYTGARVGELAQLRKQDLRREGEHWVVTITPEAGTVKTNEARDVVLHPHLAELRFPEFVAGAPAGHLFLKPGKAGDVRGPLRGLKNRLAEFAREVVPDPKRRPEPWLAASLQDGGHGGGHRTASARRDPRAGPRSVADTYGDVTVRTMAGHGEAAPDRSGGEAMSGRTTLREALERVYETRGSTSAAGGLCEAKPSRA